jgi:hypothetical protein
MEYLHFAVLPFARIQNFLNGYCVERTPLFEKLDVSFPTSDFRVFSNSAKPRRDSDVNLKWNVSSKDLPKEFSIDKSRLSDGGLLGQLAFGHEELRIQRKPLTRF